MSVKYEDGKIEALPLEEIKIIKDSRPAEKAEGSQKKSPAANAGNKNRSRNRNRGNKNDNKKEPQKSQPKSEGDDRTASDAVEKSSDQNTQQDQNTQPDQQSTDKEQ